MAAYAAQYPASARPVDEITAILIGGQPAPARHAADNHPARPSVVLTTIRHAAPGDDTPDDESEDTVTSKYLETEDPDPTVTALIRGDATDEQLDALLDGDADDQEFKFTGPKPTPAEARQIFAEFLDGLREENPGRVLQTKDFRPIFQAGMLRQWVQARLRELVEEGVLTHDEETQTYQFTEPAPVP
jgi:hypothetical protein